MMFSQRNGLVPIKVELEGNSISDELRNGLWSIMKIFVFDQLSSNKSRNWDEPVDEEGFYDWVWHDFFKQPIDTRPGTRDGFMQVNSALLSVREWFFEAEWMRQLDLVEYTAAFNSVAIPAFNRVFKREMSAYRFVDAKIVELSSEEEVKEIESVINNTDVTRPSKEHFKKALEYYGDRHKSDYRNSIKESISAVESTVKVVLGDRQTTLGAGLRRIEELHGLHPALKKGFSSIYGYTSDAGGIRHALLDGDLKIDAAEARFMLVSCSAFVNYLIVKCR